MGSGSGFLFASCDVMHPFAAVDAQKSDGGLCQVLDGDAQAEHLVVPSRFMRKIICRLRLNEVNRQ